MGTYPEYMSKSTPARPARDSENSTLPLETGSEQNASYFSCFLPYTSSRRSCSCWRTILAWMCGGCGFKQFKLLSEGSDYSARPVFWLGLLTCAPRSSASSSESSRVKDFTMLNQRQIYDTDRGPSFCLGPARQLVPILRKVVCESGMCTINFKYCIINAILKVTKITNYSCDSRILVAPLLQSSTSQSRGCASIL
jgi:hypothetical protein